MNKKKKKYTSRKAYTVIFIVMLILVSIAYASLAQGFGIVTRFDKTDDVIKEEEVKKEEDIFVPKITGVKIRTDINWKIEFENIVEEKDSVVPIRPATIRESKTEIDYSIMLKEPGEYYSFTVDIVNKGTKNARIYDVIKDGITKRQEKFLDYTVTYIDGSKLKINDTLLVGERKTINIVVCFKEDVTAEDLPSTDQELNLTYKIIYVEK